MYFIVKYFILISRWYLMCAAVKFFYDFLRHLFYGVCAPCLTMCIVCRGMAMWCPTAAQPTTKNQRASVRYNCLENKRSRIVCSEVFYWLINDHREHFFFFCINQLYGACVYRSAFYAYYLMRWNKYGNIFDKNLSISRLFVGAKEITEKIIYFYDTISLKDVTWKLIAYV